MFLHTPKAVPSVLSSHTRSLGRTFNRQDEPASAAEGCVSDHKKCPQGLKPRVLVDVTRVDTSCTVLGNKLPHPILLAPTSSHLLAHPDAETATARGAGEAKTIMVASPLSNRSIEDICRAASGPIWFQLYVDDDRQAVQALIERAEAAGCKALCITADIPMPYARNREEHIRAQSPILPFPNLGTEARPGGGGGRTRRHFNWNDLEWIQSFAKTPI